jgi:hypothetical protein
LLGTELSHATGKIYGHLPATGNTIILKGAKIYFVVAPILTNDENV